MERDIRVLRTVETTIPMPEHILFGDPSYWKDYKGEKLNSLVLDTVGKASWTGLIRIQEIEEMMDLGEFGKQAYIQSQIVIAFASKAEALETYADGCFFEGQRYTVNPIGVDTAEYLIGTNEAVEVFHTGGDGQWGTVLTVYSKNKRRMGLTLFASTGKRYSFEETIKKLESVFSVTNWELSIAVNDEA